MDIIFGSSNSQNSTNNYYSSSCDCDQDDDFFSNCNQDYFCEDWFQIENQSALLKSKKNQT